MTQGHHGSEPAVPRQPAANAAVWAAGGGQPGVPLRSRGGADRGRD